MIYHEKRFHDPGSDSLEWWAVDSDTLVMAHCRVEKGLRFYMDIIKPDACSCAERWLVTQADPGESAIQILMDCRKNLGQLQKTPAALAMIDAERNDLPGYMLMGEIGELPECIVHTSDPVFISRYNVAATAADAKSGMIALLSRKRLPASGWEYWATDAQQEFDRLLDDYLGLIQNSLRLRSIKKIARHR